MQSTHLFVLLELDFETLVVLEGEELLHNTAVPELSVHQHIVHKVGYYGLLSRDVAGICLVPGTFGEMRHPKPRVELLKIGLQFHKVVVFSLDLGVEGRG